MSSHEVGLVFSILGFVVGIIAIIIALKIHGKVTAIEIKQKENAEAPYSTNTVKNMDDIHDNFRDIVRFVKRVDFDQPESHTPITQKLDSYYTTNLEKMTVLFQKSKNDLLMWVNLDKDIRTKYWKIIENFQWLIQDYFKTNINEEVQTRMWTENYQELLNKKHEIETILQSKEEELTEI